MKRFLFTLLLPSVLISFGCNSSDNSKSTQINSKSNEILNGVKSSKIDSVNNRQYYFTGISFFKKEYLKSQIIDSLKRQSIPFTEVKIKDNAFADYDIQGNWLLNSFHDYQNCDQGSALKIPLLKIGELELKNVVVLFYADEIVWIMIAEEQKESRPRIYDLLDIYRMKYGDGVVRNEYNQNYDSRAIAEYSNIKDSIFVSFLTRTPTGANVNKGWREKYTYSMSFPGLKKLRNCARIFSKEEIDSLNRIKLEREKTLNEL